MKADRVIEIKMSIIRTAAALMSFFVAAASFSSCAHKEVQVPSPSDLTSKVESQEEPAHIQPGEAIGVLVAGEKSEELFLLQSDWYGEEFVGEDSLQKLMMSQYAPADVHAPTAENGDTVSIVFDETEPPPVDVTLTQIANTVRADTGIPYETQEPKLIKDGDYTHSFEISFGKFNMYYYLLECRWANGNRVTCCFALEKAGSFRSDD